MKYHGNTGHIAKNCQSQEEREDQFPTLSKHHQLHSPPNSMLCPNLQLHQWSLQIHQNKKNSNYASIWVDITGTLLQRVQGPSLHLLIFTDDLAAKNMPHKHHNISHTTWNSCTKGQLQICQLYHPNEEYKNLVLNMYLNLPNVQKQNK